MPPLFGNLFRESLYLTSEDLRLRFNSARTIQWFAAHNPPGKARNWAIGELIKLIENRGLEVAHKGEPLGLAGTVAFGDEFRNPLRSVLFTFALLKERRAIPGLLLMLERREQSSFLKHINRSPVRTLGAIGDDSVAPYLYELYLKEPEPELEAALVNLHHKPMVPVLLERLDHATERGEIVELLQQLLHIGDQSALPTMEKFAKPAGPEARILVLMRNEDTATELRRLLADERDPKERLELLIALGELGDSKSIWELENQALHAEYTLDRGSAISALAAMDNLESRLALIRIAETNAPPPARVDKTSIEWGIGPDYSRYKATKWLFELTGQSFGADGRSWRRWLTNHISSNQLPTVVR